MKRSIKFHLNFSYLLGMFFFITPNIASGEEPFDYDSDGDIDGYDLFFFANDYQAGKVDLSDLSNFASNFSRNDLEPVPISTVYNPATGQVWMDRNLGASRVATSYNDPQAYGDLYQWGRGADGHEKRNSPTTSVNSSTDVPGHGSFITESSYPTDWRIPQKNNLWQGESGINNPCPGGFRLPTYTELETERASWSSNYYGAFNSPLKLVAAGYRSHYDGAVENAGSYGNYWSSTVSGIYSHFLFFFPDDYAYMHDSVRAFGHSARCVED